MKRLLFLITLTTMGFVSVNQNNSTPTRRSEMASTLSENKIYIAGGINLFGSNKSFEAYDVVNRTWESLPKLPKKLNHIGLAAYEDKIYMSGGFYNALQTKFSDVLYAYNIREKQWKVITKMPDERGAHVMIQRGDYLHLIGGRNHEAVWSFHLKTQKWETDKIASLPEKRDHVSVLQDEEKLYLVGGRQNGLVKKDCWEYDFGTKKWSVFAELPTPRGGQSACLFNGQIHIAGGEDLDEGKTFERHDIFDLDKKEWSQGKPLQTARHGFVSELIDDKWHIYGGGKKAGFKTLYSTTSGLEILQLKAN